MAGTFEQKASLPNPTPVRNVLANYQLDPGPTPEAESAVDYKCLKLFCVKECNSSHCHIKLIEPSAKESQKGN